MVLEGWLFTLTYPCHRLSIPDGQVARAQAQVWGVGRERLGPVAAGQECGFVWRVVGATEGFQARRDMMAQNSSHGRQTEGQDRARGRAAGAEWRVGVEGMVRTKRLECRGSAGEGGGEDETRPWAKWAEPRWRLRIPGEGRSYESRLGIRFLHVPCPTAHSVRKPGSGRLQHLGLPWQPQGEAVEHLGIQVG